MNKRIASFIILGVLIFPSISLAEVNFEEKIRRQQDSLEHKISDRIERVEKRVIEKKERVNGKAVERAELLEDRAKQYQEKSADRMKKLEERKSAEKQDFCSNIAERMNERQGDFGERQAEFSAKKLDRSEKQKESREEVDAKLAETRSAAALRRAKMYQNLLNKAETDGQKEAVTVFKETVEQAVKEREAAIDAARATFRTEVDKAKNNKNTDGTQSIASFKSAMQTALNTAKADCRAGENQESVLKEYQDALGQAKKDLAESRQNNGAGAVVTELAKTQSVAIKTALNTYRTSLEEAFKALKVAFDEKGA